MIRFTTSGSFKNTESFLLRAQKMDVRRVLDKAGREGVAALAAATPVDSRLAAGSWRYEVKSSKYYATVTWYNTDVETGFPVAIMLQYGYATGTGGYVSGRDYINPAMKPIFDRIADDVWREVMSA